MYNQGGYWASTDYRQNGSYYEGLFSIAFTQNTIPICVVSTFESGKGSTADYIRSMDPEFIQFKDDRRRTFIVLGH